MSSTGNILPQAEIDAIVEQAEGKVNQTFPETGSASPAAASAPPVQNTAPVVASGNAAPPAQPQPNIDILNSVMAALENLSKRIENLEVNLSVLSGQKIEIPDFSGTINGLSKQVRHDAMSLTKINEQLSRMTKNLKGTPGYGAREHFVCSTCGAHGNLAVPMKCTRCGTEGWWGWYPE